MAFKNPVRSLPFSAITGQVQAGQLADDSVTAPTIATNAVGSDALAPSSVLQVNVATGAITGSKISATALDGKTITGSLIRTAATGSRWELKGAAATNALTAYAGVTGEGDVAGLVVGYIGTPSSPGVSDRFTMILSAGEWSGTDPASVLIKSSRNDGTAGSEMILTAETVTVPGVAALTGGATSSRMRSVIDVGDGTVTSTTSTTGVVMGAGGATLTFTAPPSGIVLLLYGGQVATSVAGAVGLLGYELWLNSYVVGGTLIQGYSANRAVSNANVESIRTLLAHMLTGLTPGATYVMRQVVSSSVGTATARASWGRLCAIPQH